MKRVIRAIIVASLAFAAIGRADDPKPARPNILFILSDNPGLAGAGCDGSDRFKGRTPNLDARVKSGIRFTPCYAMPLCGPSRCAINTGPYSFRTGGSTNGSAHSPSFEDEPSSTS